jgi:hypothetical protein
VSQPSVQIGPYVVGEKPVPLTYTFLDSNGNALDLTGYTAKFSIHESLGVVSTSLNAVVNAPPTAGVVQYTWAGTEFPTPGHYRARFWTGNLAQRFASILITFDVADSEGPVPAI